ncbi:MAG: hypothetical protein AAF431_05185 [Pseudomonadota bacterium]
MWFLFLQIWLWLLIAFALGWFAHWFLCCRNRPEQDSEPMHLGAEPVDAGENINQDTVDETWKPMMLAQAPEQVDDLKRIKGIGEVIEEKLNREGIYHFSQIASWTEDNTAWVEELLDFPGRIQREDWINQAKTLEAGGTTEFASRVDKGEVDYD